MSNSSIQALLLAAVGGLLVVGCAIDPTVTITTDGCEPSAEVCNGEDDDCDGMVDEGFSLASDPENCGVCGRGCDEDGDTGCFAGECSSECVPGTRDCDGDPSNGCESSLGSPDSCGACDNPCPPEAPICSTTGAENECVSDCGQTLCGLECVSLSENPAHCGACDDPCPAPEGSVPVCAGGTCGVTCASRYDECDDASAGCESLDTVEHCGACDVQCSAQNGTNPCESGACAPACDSGFGDCDMDLENGCETATSMNPAHCGRCNNDCRADEFCAAGTCTPNLTEEICAGEKFGCARTGAGEVYCWGRGGDGQIGNGADASVNVATAVSLSGPADEIACGLKHACARVGGAVHCWGENADGQLGTGSTGTDSNVPLVVPGPTDARAIGTGYAHTCAIYEDDTVRCWGANSRGQLGLDRTSGREPDPELVELAGVSGTPRQITGGKETTCLRTDFENRLYCFGSDDEGRLGNNEAVESSSTPVRASGSFGGFALGRAHACAIGALPDQDVLCWGSGNQGQLGDGLFRDAFVPVVVDLRARAADIAVGENHTCVALVTGDAVCWGANHQNQVSRSGDDQISTPFERVSDLTTGSVIRVATGHQHTCSLNHLGQVWCWGAGSEGRLGYGGTDSSDVPVQVLGLP